MDNEGYSFKSILFGILMCSLIIYMGVIFKPADKEVHDYYQVYLGGEKIGLIRSKEELYDLIDEEQQEIKEKFNVNKVFSPSGLEIQPVKTFSNDVKSAKEIYEDIKDLDPFTIEGYEVNITRSGKKTTFYVLDKADLDKAVKNTVLAFVDEDTYNKYLSGTQEEVRDEGTEITSIYFDSEVSIKKAHISIEEKIFTNPDELSQYFLFGSTDAKKIYKVKPNDTLETIAYNNELGVADLLVANPNIGGENALLAAGQEINVSPVNPLSDIVVESFDTEYQTVKYDTKIEFDKSIGTAEMYIKQQGVDGLSQVTYASKTLNGNIISTAQVSATTIKEPKDRIVVYGSKNVTYYGNTTYWAWPTVKPFRITSHFGYRVHPIKRTRHLHNGVDIAGVSSKNIFAIQGGTVIQARTSGYNGGCGKDIKIDHGNGYISIYRNAGDPLVTDGSQIDRGDIIFVITKDN